jgi:hypothetical protein
MVLLESADVIPVQVNGVMDVDCTHLSANDLMSWAVQNLWQEGEGAYAVRYNQRFVSDFGSAHVMENPNVLRPNFFEKAFPCLFLYGRGGLEAERSQMVDFLEHIRWTLHFSVLVLFNVDKH